MRCLLRAIRLMSDSWYNVRSFERDELGCSPCWEFVRYYISIRCDICLQLLHLCCDWLSTTLNLGRLKWRYLPSVQCAFIRGGKYHDTVVVLPWCVISYDIPTCVPHSLTIVSMRSAKLPFRITVLVSDSRQVCVNWNGAYLFSWIRTMSFVPRSGNPVYKVSFLLTSLFCQFINFMSIPVCGSGMHSPNTCVTKICWSATNATAQYASFSSQLHCCRDESIERWLSWCW